MNRDNSIPSQVELKKLGESTVTFVFSEEEKDIYTMASPYKFEGECSYIMVMAYTIREQSRKIEELMNQIEELKKKG